MIERKATKRGGARPGAGRPRLKIAKRGFNADIPQSTYVKVRIMAQKKGSPIGELVSEALERMWDQDGYTLLDLESYDGE